MSNRLALEFEGALNTTATLRKSPSDTSALPATLRESGLGDIQAEARWTSGDVQLSRNGFPVPATPPADRHSGLGIQAWHRSDQTVPLWHALIRAAAEYHQDAGTVDFGEYALEYLKRLSSTWRVYGGVEGTQDEVELITEVQYRLGARSLLKLNNGFGLTSKAPRWAPEVGILFSF